MSVEVAAGAVVVLGGAGLVTLDLRQSRADGWVGGDDAVDVLEAEVPAEGVGGPILAPSA